METKHYEFFYYDGVMIEKKVQLSLTTMFTLIVYRIFQSMKLVPPNDGCDIYI